MTDQGDTEGRQVSECEEHRILIAEVNRLRAVLCDIRWAEVSLNAHDLKMMASAALLEKTPADSLIRPRR